MPLQTKTVLITVKAPPYPSTKYQETNCCAGIDLDSHQWVRLYPIPFRLLDDTQKFPKYSIIKVRCERPVRDKRIESFRVDQSSIEIVDWLDTKNKWAKRKKIILPTVSLSFCKIVEDVKTKKSLGVFKPRDIKFVIKKISTTPDSRHNAPYAQHMLFDRQLKPAEQIPYAFYYEFRCFNAPDCPGHTLKIDDWEITQAYRSWRRKHRADELQHKIKQKWLEIAGPKKDVYFYVGNMWRQPRNFMILGVFYPPK